MRRWQKNRYLNKKAFGFSWIGGACAEKDLFSKESRRTQSAITVGESSHDSPFVTKMRSSLKKKIKKKKIKRDQHRGRKEGQVNHIMIGIASPKQIKNWAERRLSTGSMAGWVKDPETVEYKTHKPIKDGLFCERIFGPVVDKTCACGRFTPINTPPKTSMRGGVHFVCPSCEVEPTSSSVRRVRLGFIPLFSAVTHLWYWRGRPSYITDLLGIRERRWGENLINCHTFLLESRRGRGIAMSPSAWRIFPNINFLSRWIFLRTSSHSAPSPSISRKLIRSPRWRGIYNQSHTLPWTPFFTCSPGGREPIFDFFAEPADGEDRPIDQYCQLHRPALTTSFTDLLMNHPANREQAAQEVLCHTGGDAIRYLLSQLDLPPLLWHLRLRLHYLEEELLQCQSEKGRTSTSQELLFNGRLTVTRLNEQKKKEFMRDRTLLIRRIKVIHSFLISGRRPEWMVVSNLPVLPPGLRPIIRTADGIIATSDLNILYRRILFANKGLQKLSILNVNTIGLAKRSLQDAVDALIENGKGSGKVVIDHNTGQPLKSLSASLKGKKGRFRHHLLGKRVDYSGRSVIIVGPTLHLHQCGLPMEMAIELFSPFLIRYFQLRRMAPTVDAAKKHIRYIARQKPLHCWRILEQVMKHHPVLLNRAPTLHRLGIQAFQPILVKGRAIHLHPLVCTAFNADFDGDQMGVHIPLSFQARAEAWKLLWSPYHILSPATGQPILVPSQDMVLGCYYLTSVDRSMGEQKAPYFANIRDALCAHTNRHVGLHTPLWVRFAGIFESPTNSEEPLEVQLHSNGRRRSIRSELQRITAKSGKEDRSVGRYIRTTTGKIVMHQITVPAEEGDSIFPSR